ncbi:MAG TPA: NAD-dependent epimerase/dehydratase family protein [Devosia sp.]|jgi:nucleoside-diphosphate-sugar epimerase|nr:NAD-dependent epimerase/dehydratase family protein [Devosia sp.]
MSKGQVIVLGVNGHIGRVVAEAFVAAGWEVSGMAREDRYRIPGVRFVRGNSDSVEEMRAAIGDIDLVVNALNLPYASWDKGRKEAQMERVLAAMGTGGKTMLFPGNIYNFNQTNRFISPGLPQQPQTPRGAIRQRVEASFRAAAERGDLQVIILRAGDFYGPGSVNDWFDLAILREAAKGKVATMGLPGVGHAWAYLPDLARAFEALGSLRRTLGAFEDFHFPGHFATPEEMAAAILRNAPRPLRVGSFPLVLLKLFGLFDPTMREISKMDYQWRHPLELRDPRLEALLGPGFATPFDAAIRATITPFFRPQREPKQVELEPVTGV